MTKIVTLILMATVFFGGKAFAVGVGVDVGPVHVHTGVDLPRVRVHVRGDTEELKIVVDSILRDDDTRAVLKMVAHRKGNPEDKFEIKVSLADLDEDSKELVATRLKTEVVYKARILRLEDNWKLLTIRKNDDD
jgi:hypothetical protein